jgi:hypothetical protein
MILYLAARETEFGTDKALGVLIDTESHISAQEVQKIVRMDQQPKVIKDPVIAQINLNIYDGLYEAVEVAP